MRNLKWESNWDVRARWRSQVRWLRVVVGTQEWSRLFRMWLEAVQGSSLPDSNFSVYWSSIMELSL